MLVASGGILGITVVSEYQQPKCEEISETQTFSQLPKVRGTWQQDKSRSESLGPFLKGLGVPGFAVFFVDKVSTTLNIDYQQQEQEVTLIATAKTLFETNITELVLGAPEKEKATRNKVKKYMISAQNDEDRSVTISCRLFQRGDGWFTRQRWSRTEDGALQEEMILERPGEPVVVVKRYFVNKGQPSTLEAAGGQTKGDGERFGNLKLAAGIVGVASLGGLLWWWSSTGQGSGGSVNDSSRKMSSTKSSYV